MMRFAATLTIFTLAVIILSGCEVVRLANGKYETTLTGRDDFAAVYKDMIILRLRNPQHENGTDDGYWDWGGTYTISEDNHIKLDMSREEARRWEFYYDLQKQGNGIKITDHRAENSFRLEYIPAIPHRGTPEQNKRYPAYR